MQHSPGIPHWKYGMESKLPFPIPHTTGNPLWPGMLSVEWKSSFPFHTLGIVIRIRMYIVFQLGKMQSWNTVES